MNKITNISSSIRKFHVTTCEVCGKLDGVVEQVSNYNASRDILEWQKEGRVVTEYVKRGKEPIPFCTCPLESLETPN